MKKSIFCVFFATALFLIPPPQSFAQSADNTVISDPVEAVVKDVTDRVFGQKEKDIIEKYYKNKKAETEKQSHKQKKGKGSKKMPPGLAKKDTLPPGLAKQVQKNGKLPPGLAKRELPNDLEALLPEEKEGVERVIAGNDIVLIEKGTETVLDVMHDVLSGQ